MEEIARLAGHSSSRTTEVVYRHERTAWLMAAARPSEDPPARAVAESLYVVAEQDYEFGCGAWSTSPA